MSEGTNKNYIFVAKIPIREKGKRGWEVELGVHQEVT